MTVSGCTTCRADRQPRQARESHAQSSRSADVKRSRGPRDRWTTVSWCRSARISRCSDTRDRTKNRSEWKKDTRTDTTARGYRRIPATSSDATGTAFLVGTGDRPRRLSQAPSTGARSHPVVHAFVLRAGVRHSRMRLHPPCSGSDAPRKSSIRCLRLCSNRFVFSGSSRDRSSSGRGKMGARGPPNQSSSRLVGRRRPPSGPGTRPAE